jgi:surface carbohydrate biosynthesis protein
MAIYIAVEVSRRELEGRLLLGLVAAERGYDVVLGKMPHRALLSGELGGWRLPPGILHLKSAAGSEKIYERFRTLRSEGWIITVQDEEQGLSAQSDYADFGRTRFPPEAVELLDRSMAWGPIDAAWFSTTYPERAGDVVTTGSPRIDLWRPDLIGSAAPPTEAPSTLGEHILVVSSVSPFNVNPFWVGLANHRRGAWGKSFAGDEDPEEFRRYESVANSYRYTSHLVRAIRQLAVAHPDRTVVIRPHHSEVPEAWEAAVGDFPNVVVRADGAARSWVRDAAVVIHGGSTVAFEASIAGRPVISFTPEGLLTEHPASSLGLQARDVDTLIACVAEVLYPDRDAGPHSDDMEFLAGRLAALAGSFAADRIVNVWEQIPTSVARARVARVGGRAGHWAVADVLRRARAGVGRKLKRARIDVQHERTGSKGPFAMDVRHKFPSLDVDALRADAARLSAHLGRFDDVEIVQIGEREVLLRATGR